LKQYNLFKAVTDHNTLKAYRR